MGIIERVIDKIAEYYNYRKAEKIVRNWKNEPEFLSHPGCNPRLNQRKYLISHDVVEAMLTVSLR